MLKESEASRVSIIFFQSLCFAKRRRDFFTMLILATNKYFTNRLATDFKFIFLGRGSGGNRSLDSKEQFSPDHLNEA